MTAPRIVRPARPPRPVCGLTGTVTTACFGTAGGCGYGTCPGPVDDARLRTAALLDEREQSIVDGWR